MRRQLADAVTRREHADGDVDRLLPEAVELLDVSEVARIVNLTRPGLYKRLGRLDVRRPKFGRKQDT